MTKPMPRPNCLDRAKRIQHGIDATQCLGFEQLPMCHANLLGRPVQQSDALTSNPTKFTMFDSLGRWRRRHQSRRRRDNLERSADAARELPL
jgi:hypothetical protein